MTPRSISNDLVRDAPALHHHDTVAHAVERIVGSGLPALPVVNDRAELCGIFGEREFFQALFPGYLNQLGGAGFVTRSLESALEKRSSCRRDPVREHMNTEHIDVGEDFSDTQLAEIFLHHRVLIIPIVAGGTVAGIVTREDFTRELAQSLLASP